MNWVGDYIQDNIEETDTVLDLGCGIMQCTLDFVPTYPKTRLRCKELLGVDIYQPYLDYLNTLGVDTLKWDLINLPLPFEDNSFDIVLLNDILEHLPDIEDVDRLIAESFRIARMKVFYITPNYFFANIDGTHNPYPYDKFEGDNEYQKHHLFLDKKYLKEKGFMVFSKGVHFYGFRKLVNKILHVWDVAGVASVMCKYQNRLGYDSKLYTSRPLDTYRYFDVYEEYNIEHYFPSTLLTDKKYLKSIRKGKVYAIMKRIINQLNFTLKLRKVVNGFRPDIIHFHELFYIPLFFKLSGYKMLIEFHGTGIRYKYNDGTINANRKISKWMFRIYQLLGIPIFVSTPDLLKDVPEYNKPKEMIRVIPNPVDKDIFNISKHAPIIGMALYSLNKYDKDYIKIIESRVKQRGLNLTILNRMENEYIKHSEFPEYLSSFEYYVDRFNIGSLSKTALECLVMGLKVINWNDDLIEKLPYVHDPYNVAKLTVDIYDKIERGRI